MSKKTNRFDYAPYRKACQCLVWEIYTNQQVALFRISPYSLPKQNRELAEKIMKAYEEYLKDIKDNLMYMG